MKIAINKCYGGFRLSNLAIKEYLRRKGKDAYFYKQTKYKFDGSIEEYILIPPEDDEWMTHTSTKYLGKTTNDFPDDDSYFSCRNILRNDPDLITTIELFGEKSNTQVSKIEIVEIPDGVEWEIDEYDGLEKIDEVHKSWY